MPNVAAVSAPAERKPVDYCWRAIRSAGYGLLIGAGLSGLRGSPLLQTLAYAMPIAMLCWFFIDFGRLGLTHLLTRIGGRMTPQLAGGWPGWRWMIGVVVIGSALGFSGGTAIGDWITGQRSATLLDVHNLREVLSLMLMSLVPAVIITYFFYSRSTIVEQEAAIQTAQRLAAENQLKLLESQLEPHMLFNTLANLRVLIGIDPLRAQAMLDQLIAFLRATLKASRTAAHPLAAEFARTADYLALMQIRMGTRLQTRLDLPESLADVTVPPLLLQPLVENAIKHGLEPSVGGGRIDVSAARDGTDLILTVRDTGVGLTAAPADGDGTRFGLAQVRERLATLYGDHAAFAIADADDGGGGARAVVRLPLPSNQTA
ncbi:MAG: histidine kinase [Proteobacteria bacterium]|nr:histidine kinase [Pseudomonadota bacterium]